MVKQFKCREGELETYGDITVNNLKKGATGN